MSRKRKISTEELNNIITEYIYYNKYVPKIKYTELVAYAETIGYNLHPNDFGRNEEIKNKIKQFNEMHKIPSVVDSSETYIFSEIDVERIINLGKYNIENQRMLLNLYKDNHNKAYDEIIRLSELVEGIIKENEEKTNQIKVLREKNKELTKTNEQQLSIIKSEKLITIEERFMNYMKFLSDNDIFLNLNNEDIERMMRRLFKINKKDMQCLEEDEKIVLENEKNKVISIKKEKLSIPKIPNLFSE